MTNEERDRDDYVRSWRHDYDAAREARNGCMVGWLACSIVLALWVSGGTDWLYLAPTFALGGYTLALLGHYQGVIHTYYQALKGTRDEPPRDELAARRRR